VPSSRSPERRCSRKKASKSSNWPSLTSDGTPRPRTNARHSINANARHVAGRGIVHRRKLHGRPKVDRHATYTGKGWKVYIPVIHSASCPAQAITGNETIVGWTEFVITQVIDKGNCAVANHFSGNQWDAIGKLPNCKGTNTPKNSGALRAVFGYYSCKIIPSNPVPTPTPRSALATKLRLVR
jgi:hypothetical protein